MIRENLEMMAAYRGSGSLLFLYAAAFVFLFFAERDKWKRALLLYVPLLLLVIVTVTPLRALYTRVLHDSATYYRFLWLLPMGVTIAYGAVTMMKAHLYTATCLAAALIVFCGSLVYRSPYITRAENPYHIPQHVVEICDKIHPAKEGVRVMAAFPSELTYFVRQYDTDICMPFGRDMAEAQWNYHNAVYEVMEEADTVDMTMLKKVLDEAACRYLILWHERALSATPESVGMTKIAEMNGYEVWEL